MSNRIEFKAELPEKLAFLFESSRYKVLYGGRGGSKSWGIARALLSKGTEKPLRILCARELQRSIADSVHQLLKDQIAAIGLLDFYDVQKSVIRGVNGTEFQFCGLRHNATELKSHEGADICWVEEANTVSKASWEILIPTIRKPDSEIWVSFNPELETDETYKRFVLETPPNSRVVKIGWRDNPWFPDVLKQEMETLQARDKDAFLTVWEGHCRQSVEGAIYANEIRSAMEGSRITRVPYDPTKPVHTYWDLGYSDYTSLWFAQVVGFEFRIVDFYQNQLQSLQHYLQVLQNRGYVYGKDWLPHDAKAKQLGTGKSIQEMMEAAGRKVEIVPQLSVVDGINAARAIFPMCYFDAEKCADGLNCLRRYR